MWGRSLVPGAPRGRSRLEPPLRAWGGEIGGDTGEMQKISSIDLPFISPACPLPRPCEHISPHISPISPISRLYLPHISPISRLYIPHISPISRL